MANTLHRAYPRPDTARTIADEFPVSDVALVAIDADIHALFEALVGKAATGHSHALADVTGLIDALAGKAANDHAHSFDDLSDVSGMAAAPDGYVPVKSGAGWIPGSPASVIGSHEHAITDVVNLQTALDAKVATSWIATAANYLAKVADKILTVVAIWDAAVEVTIPYAASVAIDFNTLQNGKITLTGPLTLAQPTNQKGGQSGCIRLIQDATGGRTVAFHSDWKFAGGTDPSASTPANAIDYLFYHIVANGTVYAALNKAVS